MNECLLRIPSMFSVYQIRFHVHPHWVVFANGRSIALALRNFCLSVDAFIELIFFISGEKLLRYTSDEIRVSVPKFERKNKQFLLLLLLKNNDDETAGKCDYCKT